MSATVQINVTGCYIVSYHSPNKLSNVAKENEIEEVYNSCDEKRMAERFVACS